MLPVCNLKFCRRVAVDDSKVTAAVWGPVDEYIVTGHVNGALSQYNILDVRAQ